MSTVQSFAFLDSSTLELEASLNEIHRKVAVNILSLISLGVRTGRKIDETPEGVDSLVRLSESAILEFGEDASYFTNVEDVEDQSSIDEMCLREWQAFTPHPIDYGLVVVSTTEVGVFWTYDSP